MSVDRRGGRWHRGGVLHRAATIALSLGLATASGCVGGTLGVSWMGDGRGDGAVFLELGLGATWTPAAGEDDALIVDVETRRDLGSELGREVDVAVGWMDVRVSDWLAARADGRFVARDDGADTRFGAAVSGALLWVMARGGADPRECGVAALGLGLRAAAFSSVGPGPWGAFRFGGGPRLELRPLRSAGSCAREPAPGGAGE